jgi:hypothetical protein
VNDEVVALLKEIRDSMKSIDERLTKLGDLQHGLPAKLGQVERAMRDLAGNIANQTYELGRTPR